MKQINKGLANTKGHKKNRADLNGKHCKSNLTVFTKYQQPHLLFSDLPEKYRFLIEFDTALIKEHYKNKKNTHNGYAFLHEPYFE